MQSVATHQRTKTMMKEICGEKKVKFESLPDDVLQRIVRFLSTTPHYKTWTMNVDSRTILSMYQSGGVFRYLARTNFCYQLVSSSGAWGRDKAGVEGDCVTIVCDNNGDEKFSELIAFSSFHCHSIDVTHSARFSRWTKSAALCKKLRALCVRDTDSYALVEPLCELLRLRGAGLEKLRLQGASAPSEAVCRAVEAHCGGVEELELEFGALPSATCRALWRGLGATLLRLAVKVKSTPTAVFYGDIARDCLTLSSVALDTDVLSDGEQMALTSLFCGLGAKLSTVTLTGSANLTPMQWRDVCTSCRIMNVELRSWTLRTVDAAVAIGPQLRALSFEAFDESRSESMGNCVGLRNLQAKGTAVAIKSLLRRIDGAPLREAKLAVTGSAMEVVDALTVSCNALCQFTIGCTWLPVRAFDAFALANAELRDVTIVFNGIMAVQRRRMEESNEGADVLVSIVNAFAKCKHLTKLTVLDISVVSHKRYDQVIAACVPLKQRRISVTICGVQYAE